jgi:hypothetical protein
MIKEKRLVTEQLPHSDGRRMSYHAAAASRALLAFSLVWAAPFNTAEATPPPHGWPDHFWMQVMDAPVTPLNGEYLLYFDESTSRYTNGDRPNPWILILPRFDQSPIIDAAGTLTYDEGWPQHPYHAFEFRAQMTPAGFRVEEVTGSITILGPGNVPEPAALLPIAALAGASLRRSDQRRSRS